IRHRAPVAGAVFGRLQGATRGIGEAHCQETREGRMSNSQLKHRELDLATLTLQTGAHTPDHAFCVMEAAAYLSGEQWSDSPQCVSPVITAFLRDWNDCVDDTFRQRLKPYIERVLYTRT